MSLDPDKLSNIDILQCANLAQKIEEIIFCQVQIRTVGDHRVYIARKDLAIALKDYAEEIVRACRNEPRK
jgi:hypothetical protein